MKAYAFNKKQAIRSIIFIFNKIVYGLINNLIGS